MPENYEDSANERIIISSAIVGGIAILAIIITVVITGTSAEHLPATPTNSVNVPPVTMFPPSPAGSSNSVNGSAVMSEVALEGSVQEFEDKKDGESALHANELI